MKYQVLKINENNHEALKEIDGGNTDKKLNVLMDIVDPIMPMVDYSDSKKSIKVYSDTAERLDSFKITAPESRDNILTRMLIALNELNNTSAVEEWIPFKITNKYNDLLVIDGQMEYASREMSFNYRGNVFRRKLPPNYIINGKNLTKELYMWYDDLDWNRIIDLLLEHVDDQTIIEENSYILEINDVFKQG